MDKNKDKIKYVHWNITRRCNYDCSYCSTKNKRTDKNAVEDVSPEFFLEQFRKYLKGKWVFNLSGSGEPFLAPQFFDIVEELVKMGHRVRIMTNFSAPSKKILEFVKICGDNLFELGASLHLEMTNPDEFLNKAVLVEEIIGDKFFVCSVARKGRLQEVEKIGQKFRKNGISFSLQFERDRSKINPQDSFIGYSEKEQAVIKQFRKSLNDKSSLKLKGKLCFSGARYFCLNEDGSVYRCWPALKAKNISGDASGYLGNLLGGDFRLKNRPSICPYDCCYCSDPIRLGMIPDFKKP